MRYFRDSKLKYPDKTLHAWRLNDDGTVDFRDNLVESWTSASVLTDYSKIEDSIMLDNVEEIGYNPFQEYLCDDN